MLSKVEDSSVSRLHSITDSSAVRWYIMVLPAGYKGNPARGLQVEMARRARFGEPVFEYFAPSFVEVKEVDGKLVRTDKPLLYNYVFIHGSETDIYRMKQYVPQYNFLSRVRNGRNDHYPYLSDEAMGNLRWVAESYSNVLPVYAPDPSRLMKGDRVRIIKGQFKGAEATVLIQPGAGRKDVMVCVDNCMWVPLLSVKPGEYEVIALNNAGRHVYTRLGSDRLPNALHEALQRYHGPEGVNRHDRELAEEALREYGSLELDTDVMRCKVYSVLLPAYLIIGDGDGFNGLLGTVLSILPVVKAEQSRALLLVVLYGCTDSSIYFRQAHEIVDRWRGEAVSKKSKRQLVSWLDDFDKWLGHHSF